MGIPKIVCIILTFNSQNSIEDVLQSVQKLANRIVVVDSYSQDNTLQIVKKYTSEIVQHEFDNYSVQRNWAQEYARLQCEDWVLHLDSDEVISSELASNIIEVFHRSNFDAMGYCIQRRTYFMGKPIRFGHTNPNWHLRLFRADQGCCEKRRYDQHFIMRNSEAKVRKLKGLLLDLQNVTLEQWIHSHNRWSSAEAFEIVHQQEQEKEQKLPAKLWSLDIRLRKRWWKNKLYYVCPPLLRAFVLFFYCYILRLGFLDGKVGLIYHVLQAFWFRFLVDAKIMELKNPRLK